MENVVFATGAKESIKDPRTVKHETIKTMAGIPLLQGGYDYIPADIQHQHYVGICTAISLTQNAGKALNKKKSADFQYLLQKKYVDGNWYEGSAILSALKVGKKYGFLDEELFADPSGKPYIVEFDRQHSNPGQTVYQTYISKLKAIPDSEIQRLIGLCTDKLVGYAQVDVTSSQAIAKAISDSKAGILCMYNVGAEWYTAKNGNTSWLTADINPIRPPNPVTSGHAITYAKFDYTVSIDGLHANTWGTDWNKKGLGDIIWTNYRPVEGWIPYYQLSPEQVRELEDVKNRLAIELQNTTPGFAQFLKNYAQYLINLIINKYKNL